MPGIGGYWTLHQRLLWVDQTQQFINPMIWRNEDQVKMFEMPDKGVLLSSVASPTYHISGIEQDRFYKSVFYGKLYSINNEKSHSDVYQLHRYMVEEYLENGQDFLTKIEGVFLLAIYDYVRDELSIINDAFGSLPLNFYLNNDDLIFSSQMQSIQSLITTSLNESAFAEHLSMGITLNGKTFLKKIERLWPGSILKINRQKFENIKYFKPVYAINSDMHIEKKLQISGDIFKNFIKENLDPDLSIAAALSGGYDSRLFWSAIYNQNIPATATTFGEPSALDLKVADLIAKKLNLSHEVLILTASELVDFQKKAEELIHITEGFSNIESAILIPYYQWLMKRYRILIDGTGSALYRRQVFWRNSHLLRSKDELPEFIFNAHQFGNGTFDPDKSAFIADHQANILSNLEEYFSKYQDDGTIQDLIDLFYLHHYIGFRFSSDLMFQTQYIDSFHPFCNLSIYQIIRGLSVNERRKLLFHKYHVHHFESRLESIPLVNSGILVPYHGFEIRRILPVGLTILKERYNIKIIPNRYKRYPVFSFREAYKKGLLPFVKDLLMEGKTGSRPYWNRQVIEKNLGSYCEDSIDYSKTITNLITAELILRKFIDKSV